MNKMAPKLDSPIDNQADSWFNVPVTQINTNSLKVQTMIHDVYGTPFHTDRTDETIVLYWLHAGQMIIGTYDRRSTCTTYRTTGIPRSMN